MTSLQRRPSPQAQPERKRTRAATSANSYQLPVRPMQPSPRATTAPQPRAFVAHPATSSKPKQARMMAWFREHLHVVLCRARVLGIPWHNAVILLDYQQADESGNVPSFNVYSETAMPLICTALGKWMPAGKADRMIAEMQGCLSRRRMATRDYVACAYVSRFKGSVLIGCFMLQLNEIKRRGGQLALLV